MIRRPGRARLLLQAVTVLVVVLAWWEVGLFDPQRLLNGVRELQELLPDILSPRFNRWLGWMLPLYETLCISIASTAIAVILTLPMAFLANWHTSPHRLLYGLTRTVLSFLRALPDLLLAMLLVAVIGFGQLPGTLALAIHSVGMVGKFFSEAIEQADPSPSEALFSTGADRLQVFVHVILPQCLPGFLDLVFYRWEFNFRSAIVLGAVGAGGIGTQLISALRLLDYGQVTALLLVIFVAVCGVDLLAGQCRRAFH